jgi:hypothetical protein
MTPNEKLELQVAEEEDGSATVMLPEGEENPQDDDVNESSSENNETDEEREQIRAARREERRLKKQIHREKTRESSSLINTLRKQNEALAERLALVERKTSGAELARVDKAIEDAGVEVEYAKMKLTEAVNQSDGSAAIQAQEMLYDAKRRQEALANVKKQATQQTNRSAPNAPDPRVTKYASEWMEDNPWYDPNGKNVESKIALAIDNALTEEGYDPSSMEYWEELQERVDKHIPNTQNRVYNDSNRRTRPRSVVTSSGRESHGSARPNEYILSPEKVTAMKEAGKWDNLQERKKMIDYYRKHEQQNKVRG